MTPDRATRRKRRRIRLAIRRTSALAAAIAFFFAWGTIGAIETDAVSLVEGTVRTFGLLFIGTGFAFVSAHKYRLSPYNCFIVKEPKERLIMYNSFRDKIVQHSLCDNVLEPYLSKTFIWQNYYPLCPLEASSSRRTRNTTGK